MVNINQILESNEVVEWNSKPDEKVIKLLSLIIGIICGSIILAMLSQNYSNLKLPQNLKLIFLPITFILSIGVVYYIGKLWYNSIEYIITNKKVILQSGIIGRDFTSIDFDKIRNITVEVNIIGTIFKVGSILIDSGKIKTVMDRGSSGISVGKTEVDYDKFLFIKKPYEILKILNSKVSQRKEKLYSGRADFVNNKKGYQQYVQETEQMKKNI